jgi:hypothetical protein
MNATVSLVLAIVGLGGLTLLIHEIIEALNRGNIAQKDAQVLDLSKKIQDQKINLNGEEKTAQELLDAYRKQAKEFNSFDNDDDPNKPAS